MTPPPPFSTSMLVMPAECDFNNTFYYLQTATAIKGLGKPRETS